MLNRHKSKKRKKRWLFSPFYGWGDRFWEVECLERDRTSIEQQSRSCVMHIWFLSPILQMGKVRHKVVECLLDVSR